MVNKKSVSKKLIAILLAVVLVIGTLPVGFASVFAAQSECLAVNVNNKKVYFFGAETLELDKSKATVIHYTTSAQSNLAIYVDGKSEVDTTGVTVDQLSKTIDFGAWLANQDKWVAVQLDDTKTVPSSEPNVDVDETAPEITEISGNPSEWTNKDVTLTVETEDNKGGTGVVAYSKDEINWQSEAEFNITKNGTYTFYAKDAVGNVSEKYEIKVEKIDKIDPIISSVSVAPDSWTNQEVSLIVTASDLDSGLAENAYKIDDGEWQSDNEFKVNDSVEHTFYVRDSAGNVAKIIQRADKHDIIKPVISNVEIKYGLITIDRKNKTSSKIDYNFYVIATDENSGVAQYSKDGVNWQNENKFVIKGAGDYAFYVKDNAGNISNVYSFSLGKDETAPTINDISADITTPTNKEITITVDAVDNEGGAGLADKAYKIDNNKWQESNQFKINDCDEHTIYVRDSANPKNIAEKKFRATNFNDVTPKISTIKSTNDDNKTKWMNSAIKVEVSADPTMNSAGTTFEIKEYGISDSANSNIKWQEGNIFEITDCKTHYFYVKDCADKISEVTKNSIYTADNFDNNVPKLVDGTAVKFTPKNENKIAAILNKLTFGRFFNKTLVITVDAEDIANETSNASGIVNAEFTFIDAKSNKYKFEAGTKETGNKEPAEIEFNVKADDLPDNFKGTASVTLTDAAGNVKTYQVTTNNSDMGEIDNKSDFSFMIENVAPKATIDCPNLADDKNPATDDHNDWCGDDTDFNIKINDADSGIRSVSVTVNGTAITTDSDGAVINEKFYEKGEKTTELSFRVNTRLATRAEDGSYTIKVEATDNAGNVMEPAVTKTIYKDTSTPSVTDFKFTAKGYAFDKSVESANTAPVEETSYGYYFIKDTEVTVTADDGAPKIPSSGVKSITYYTVDKDGVKSEEKTEPVNKDNQITFTVKANFKGQIYAKACDNVGHTPNTFSKPNGAVIESPDLHTQTSAIKYTLKDSKDSNGADIKDEKGNNLYGADTTVDVEIADTYSGIRQIDWEIVSPFDDKKQAGTVTVDNNGKITSVAKKGYSDDCLGDWVATGEANTNLIVNLKNTIKVSNDSNNIQIKFTLTDRAGNVTKDVVQTLSIDKTAPKIAVHMNENDDKEFNGYFKGSREADIYVYERNFSQSDVVFDVKRTDDNNKQTNISPKSKFKYVGTQVIDGRECFVYKMTTKFTADGDYNFKVSASDVTSHIANAESVNYKSDNKSVKFSSDKTAEYTAQNDADRAIDIAFTIDNTNPVVSVSYDNNTAANDKYFNAYRTATITVVEHNFSTAASRIIYKRTSAKDGSNIAEPTVSSWSRKGNTYTATIKYNADGDYTFDMQVIDKAGNKDKGVKFSGTAAKGFTVDTTIAKPSIKGVENGKSYKGSVLPSISFNDINIANSEIKLLRTRKNEINKDVTSDFIKISKNAKGGSFTANEETFKKLQENDGIYTLSVNISDKAGNKSSQTVKFTVNRFGSVYALNKYLVNDLNNSYVQSIDNNLVITEYNPDKLVKGTLDVVVTRDGSPVEFGDGQLTVNPVVNSTVQIGQSGWYQYNYTISKDLFTDDNGKAIDGIYKIYIASKDEVGNKSENINYKDADVIFRLDTTAPALKSVSGLEKSVVNATKLDVSYEIFDSIGIKSIDVYYVNENGIDSVDHIRSKDSKEENVAGYIEDVTSYSGKFTIGECSKENVRFVITDLAGNVTDTGDSNNKAVNFDSSSLEFNSTITVSTNPFTRWYAHTVLFWCSIAAIAVAIGAGGFAVATKLRKREEKATEDYKNSKKNK